LTQHLLDRVGLLAAHSQPTSTRVAVSHDVEPPAQQTLFKALLPRQPKAARWAFVHSGDPRVQHRFFSHSASALASFEQSGLLSSQHTCINFAFFTQLASTLSAALQVTTPEADVQHLSLNAGLPTQPASDRISRVHWAEPWVQQRVFIAAFPTHPHLVLRSAEQDGEPFVQHMSKMSVGHCIELTIKSEDG
jgi:hypothetical protein